jgi:hypothetical protein
MRPFLHKHLCIQNTWDLDGTVYQDGALAIVRQRRSKASISLTFTLVFSTKIPASLN